MRIVVTRIVGVLTIGLALAWPSAADAGPTSDTLEAWRQYVTTAERRIARELDAGPFLWRVDAAALRGGGVAVTRVAGGSDVPVPGGTIHHWRGAVLVPGVRLDALLAELQSPDGSRHRQADVLEWRLLSGGGSSARVFLKLTRSHLVTVTYNSEHDVEYRRHGTGRASSRSVATRIAELEHANTGRERERPPGEDRGFLWRLNSYWRYEQTETGVMVQVESLTLSRHVPALLKPLAQPLIHQVARESLVRTLEAVRQRFAA
jgi:hypothetical protein